ncbi:arginine deiminase-related protein [Fusobacteria bacterium ZRK30]|nr:arginine deiminase-related protein [Fusobacteria bacterium ZRK30]
MNNKVSQITDTILMIKPVRFHYNPETAVNNYYQTPPCGINNTSIQEKALIEFDNFVNTLEHKGIEVLVVEDTLYPPTPDSIFPNNWISFHHDGRIALYPMFAKNRRLERRMDILDILRDKKFKIYDIIDYSKFEEKGIFLEGTGSMILDRPAKKVYCALSPRADLNLLNKFCSDFDYIPILFHAYQWSNKERLPIYHTNVLMAIGEEFAILCSSSIDDISEKNKVISELSSHGKTIIDITEKQVEKFAGNALQVKNSRGDKYLILSKTAKEILSEDQIRSIERTSKILSVDIDTIQKYGGGSVRCMMAEIFLSRSK